ncbi:MAG TPA: adenylate kinase [Thermoplasmatales archaeon]|nr:adenylate kinase [Candidatus Thermoplasmatota archaeon]MDD5778799.1 adenylate kinase [Candidatus Thermoplasmatota archaeon]HDS58925.1 adenylate kinase [Thermoplasmatales archaeon]
MVVILSGIPGAGKTTVMQKALEKKPLKFVTYGTVMFDLAREKMGVEDRDAMRTLPVERQRQLQEMTADRVAEMGDVVVDTHCTIKTPAGYLPGFPYDILKRLRPRLVILVEASPQEIAARRSKDQDVRQRDPDTVEEMEEHQMMNRMAAMTYATLVGATVKIIHNREGRLEEAADQIVQALG